MKNYKILKRLYENHKECAERFGLSYSENTNGWIRRVGNKKSFSYTDEEGNKITDKNILSYIEDLIIPPMWNNTRISTKSNNHILAIGEDNMGRSQYLYHRKWGDARNLINSYKLIIFGNYLGNIRKVAKRYLRNYEPQSFKYALGAFILIMDETVIRVGSTYYLEENDTIGLSVMQNQHISKNAGRIYFVFQGKSEKNHKVIITDKKCKQAIRALQSLKKKYLFSYQRNNEWFHITAQHANTFMKEVGTGILSIKDFRTWHASVIFFQDILSTINREMQDTERKKLILSSFDDAAAKLGNTRNIVRSSYVHSGVAESVEKKKFLKIYDTINTGKKKRNLTQMESSLLYFLEYLYENDFHI